MTKQPQSFSIDEEVAEWLSNANFKKSSKVNAFLRDEMKKQRIGKETVLQQKIAEIETEIQTKKTKIEQLKDEKAEVESELERLETMDKEVTEQMTDLADKLIQFAPDKRDFHYEPIGPFGREEVISIIEDVGIHHAEVDEHNRKVYYWNSEDNKIKTELEDAGVLTNTGTIDDERQAAEILSALTEREVNEIETEVEQRLADK